MAKPEENDGRRLVARNRKARHEYHFEDTIEAGLQLTGSEVKSLRAGRVTLQGSYAIVRDGEVFLREASIPPYEQASLDAHDPDRERKLLLSRREIERLETWTMQKGYTLVPLAVYFRGPWAKLELGLARGKREYDKRAALRDRELEREQRRAVADWRRE